MTYVLKLRTSFKVVYYKNRYVKGYVTTSAISYRKLHRDRMTRDFTLTAILQHFVAVNTYLGCILFAPKKNIKRKLYL